jgi:hypothetical protein
MVYRTGCQPTNLSRGREPTDTSSRLVGGDCTVSPGWRPVFCLSGTFECVASSMMLHRFPTGVNVGTR